VRLVHYSAKPLGLPLRPIDPERKVGLGKPPGFWVSVDGNGDGWKEWCESEDWGMGTLKFAHEIELAPAANVLKIEGAAALDEFHWEFVRPNAHRYDYDAIDWPRVMSLHQGIIIAPYIHERRLSDVVNWYYTWDCASGVIWDLKAIDRIELKP